MRVFAWGAVALLLVSTIATPALALAGARPSLERPEATSSASTATAPAAPATPSAPGVSASLDATSSPSLDATSPPDPDRDVRGWENGYWHNESIAVNQSDGLSDAEIDRFVARSMARVEYLRNKEFRRTVPVEIISREKYRNRSSGARMSGPYAAWNNQVWEALFIVGEEKNVQRELHSTLGSSVAGFYSPADDEIKIITDTPREPTIDNATLIHELTHALQDQHYNLSQAKYSPDTQDAQLATDGIVEGEANYIEKRYTQRCGKQWECVRTPKADGGSGGPRPQLGILLILLQPYSDGPVYVHTLRQRGGWPAVSQRFRHPPNATEQVIHVTDEAPKPIDYRDRSTAGWERFEQGQNGSDTVGEASIFVMFWYQAREYGADTINPRLLTRTDKRYDTYNYDSAPSDGWANDRVFPYRKNTSNGTQYGYVWVTEWDTVQDAKQFRNTYLHILRAHNAERRQGVYVVPDGPFDDAFRVTRQGTRVTIVNGPTPAAVERIRPRRDTATRTATPVPLSVETEQASGGMPSELFGVSLELVAVAAALALVVVILGAMGAGLVALVLFLRD